LCIIAWFHGLYTPEIIKAGFGGGLRSIFIENMLANSLGCEAINITYRYPYKKNNIYRNIEYIRPGNLVELDLTLVSKILRIPIGLLQRITTHRLSLKFLFLNINKNSITKLIKYFHDRNIIVVFDGIKGYVMAKRIINKINSKLKIYLSHNFESDFYIGFKRWIEKNEREAIQTSDITIAASTRDAIKYKIYFNINNIVIFPNIFPTSFILDRKNEYPTLAIIAGSNPSPYLKIIKYILKYTDYKIIYIGKFSNYNIIKKYNDKIEYYKFIKDRSNFLKVLSKAHAGLNYGVWLGGSNVKRYDYALAGLAIFSNAIGARGDVLPGEVVFADIFDLIGKLNSIDINELTSMGKLNKDKVINIYKKSKNILINSIKNFINI
jgi:hypothetical protein